MVEKPVSHAGTSTVSRLAPLFTEYREANVIAWSPCGWSKLLDLLTLLGGHDDDLGSIFFFAGAVRAWSSDGHQCTFCFDWTNSPGMRIKKFWLPHVLHIKDGLEPQNLILWRSLHATPVFYMKNDPRFGGSSKLIFFENVSCNRPSWYKTYQLSGSHSVEALSPKKSICAQKAINFSFPTKIVVAANKVSSLSCMLASNRVRIKQEKSVSRRPGLTKLQKEM